jgi:hypothetical protein
MFLVETAELVFALLMALCLCRTALLARDALGRDERVALLP